MTMTMEERLHKAAVKGDLESLKEILEENPQILAEIKLGCLTHTPLHVAASKGHLDFVVKILEKNEALAGVVDLRRWSPLHLACADGHRDVVRVLIDSCPEMCMALDGDGKSPLHLAAIKGRRKVLEAVFDVKPFSDHELLNAKDASGNTILHLSVKHRRYEVVEYLLEVAHQGVKDEHTIKAVNALNASGDTAYDILLETKRDVENLDQIKGSFRRARALRAKDLTQGKWLTKKREALMVVASLIATMAFQAGVNPPGGVWQSNVGSYRAGEAVMASNYPDSFPYFLRLNTVGLVLSLSTILLLITGWPFKKKLFMWILIVIMWVTITSIAFTYAYSIVVITPKKYREALKNTIVTGAIVWCSVMLLLLLTHTIRLIDRWLKSIDIHVGLKIRKVFRWQKIKEALELHSEKLWLMLQRRNTSSVAAHNNAHV